MGKTKYNSEWLNRNDCHGIKISLWCDYRDSEYLFCKTCCKTFSYSFKGFQAIQQHSKYSAHTKNTKVLIDNQQLHLKNESLENGNLKTVILCSPKESTIKAELIWAMRTVASNWSAASCDQNADDFKIMFPGPISDTFSLGRTKLTYLLTDALGPYFKKDMLDQIKGEYYSLIYDETTNSKGKKELQTAVRFWSKKRGEVVVHNLETFFIEHGTGEILSSKLTEALDKGGIELCKLLMLGSDGPNVNKKVFRLINEHVKDIRGKRLFDLGTCNINIVHNAFLKGIKELGEDSSELIREIYYFFKDRPARREDFTQIQVKLKLECHYFIKHVPTRWLTIDAAIKRILEQWTALNEYFLKFIPTKLPTIKTARGYKAIVKFLESPTIITELHFLLSTTKVFTKFTHVFQEEAPLIHILHSELSALVQTLLGRFINAYTLTKFNKGEDILPDLDNEDNLVPLKFLECGKDVNDSLKSLNLSHQHEFLCNAQKFYIASCRHLLIKSPMNMNSPSHILKYGRCLHPMEVRKSRSCRDIIKFAQILPFDIPSDSLHDEWKSMQLEKVSENLKEGRVDHFWNNIFLLSNSNGNQKFPNIQKIVKCLLSLSHGSADVERGFSRSSRFLPQDRNSMSLRVLNARLIVTDGLHYFKNIPTAVPITKNLLFYAYSACSNYKSYLESEAKLKEEENMKKQKEKHQIEEEQKLAKELDDNRKQLVELETNLKELKQKHVNKQKNTDTHLSEASERLKKALEKGNLQEAMLAQTMLEGAVRTRKEENEQLHELKSMQTRVDKRKLNLITNFFSKRSKK